MQPAGDPTSYVRSGRGVLVISRRPVMPNHKLTLLGHPAFKAAQRYLQFNEAPLETTRVAFADGVIAISGDKNKKMGAGDFCKQEYGVDLSSEEVVKRFNAMIQSYAVKQMEIWKIENCAEAHLWMTLTGMHAKYLIEGQAPRHRHGHPKQLHLWVYEIDRKNRPKEDSPCLTCRQWVRREFLTVNGTS
jgi:hypothetical protein